MPVYRYVAKSRFGEKIKGIYEASDRAAVVNMIREKSFFPVDIKEYAKSRGFSLSKLFCRVTIKDLSVFCRQFSTVVNAGVPIPVGLDILRKQTENTGLRHIIDNIFEEVQKGKNLSQVMGSYKGTIFPELLVNMVRTGEISGTLGKVMDRMASHYEKEYKLGQKVKNAIAYPFVVLTVSVSVVIFLVTVILPTFASMFRQMGALLPLSTRILMAAGSIVRDDWLLLLAVLAGLVLGIKIYASTQGGKRFFDELKLKLPIIGTVNKKIITARFARTLGTLLASGISMLQSIDIAKRVVENTVIQKSLSRVEDGIKNGKGLSEPLKSIEAFPPMLIHMAKIGEDTGTLEYMLIKTSDFYDDEVENEVTKMTTLLEPAIIIGLAVVVGFIVVSIVLPMFKLMTNVNF